MESNTPRAADDAVAYEVLPLAPCPWQVGTPGWEGGYRWWIVRTDNGDKPFRGDGFLTKGAAMDWARKNAIRISEGGAS